MEIEFGEDAPAGCRAQLIINTVGIESKYGHNKNMEATFVCGGRSLILRRAGTYSEPEEGEVIDEYKAAEMVGTDEDSSREFDLDCLAALHAMCIMCPNNRSAASTS